MANLIKRRKESFKKTKQQDVRKTMKMMQIILRNSFMMKKKISKLVEYVEEIEKEKSISMEKRLTEKIEEEKRISKEKRLDEKQYLEDVIAEFNIGIRKPEAKDGCKVYEEEEDVAARVVFRKSPNSTLLNDEVQALVLFVTDNDSHHRVTRIIVDDFKSNKEEAYSEKYMHVAKCRIRTKLRKGQVEEKSPFGYISKCFTDECYITSDYTVITLNPLILA